MLGRGNVNSGSAEGAVAIQLFKVYFRCDAGWQREHHSQFSVFRGRSWVLLLLFFLLLMLGEGIVGASIFFLCW